MKKRFNLATLIVLMALTAVAAYLLTLYRVQKDLNAMLDEFDKQKSAISAFVETQQYIEDYFVGEWTEQLLIDGAAAGMIASLGDRWSHYLTAEEYAAYQDSRDNRYSGIGVSAMPHGETGGILITEVYAGSPAVEAGLAPLDVIVSVDGAAVEEIGYAEAVERIRGLADTQVVLGILTRDGAEKTVSVMRRSITREAISTKILGETGYVKVLNFDARVDKDFLEAVGQLLEAGVTGLVFDMRGNPGGALSVLVPMLDYLLPEGRLITMRDKNGVVSPYDSDAQYLDMPMVVLINGESYSAAEFFAACLQEYGKAVIVGEKTVGKGYAQDTYRLSNGAALILSSNEYFTPSGRSLAGVGLTPDYEVIFTDEENMTAALMTPEEDRQLQKALEVLRAAG